ncbi:MAG: FAD-binding protein [Solirubrobacterales bacterium]|nr:FAD-binding protein [Solirubrobacterales bacterium]
MTRRWRNWTGDQIWVPHKTLSPASERELARQVAEAADQGLNVHAIGSAHSFSDCAATDGVLVDTSRLNQIREIDRDSGRVTVDAGIKLADLGPKLAAAGLALENQGDIDRQSVAGAISTATHGTGAKFPNLAAQITGLSLITADGQVRQLSADTDNEAFLAARVSFGSLGVISAATIQCVPLYTLHRVDYKDDLDSTLSRLDQHVDSSDHFEFFVFPYTRTALCRKTRRSSEEPDPTPMWRRRLEEEGVENLAMSALARTGKRIPALTPRLNRLITGLVSGAETEDRAYKVYATMRRVRFNEMEYALPRAAVAEAVDEVLELVESHKLPILFPLEVRFAAGDDAFLSTAHGRETGYIAVHQYRGMEFETFFRGVEAIMDSHGGRPHWGKRHYQNAATLAPKYPDWERFAKVRSRLDPDRVFTNEYARRVLG